MKIIKPGNYEPELEGTCTRCGQVEQFVESQTEIVYGSDKRRKACGLCGWDMDIKNIKPLPEPIDRPSAEELSRYFHGGHEPYLCRAERLLETFDIRRKK